MHYQLHLGRTDCCYNSRRGFPYAPYVMYVIEKVTSIWFHKETEHPVLKINRTKQPNAPKTPSPASDESQSQSPPPADSPPRRSHRTSRPSGTSSSRGPTSRAPPVEKLTRLARRVLEAVFCMCK